MGVSSYGVGGRGYNPLDYYKQQLLPLASLSDYTKDKTLKDTSTSSADALAGSTGQMGSMSITFPPPVPEPAEGGSPVLGPSPDGTKPKDNSGLAALAAYGPLAIAYPTESAIAAGTIAAIRGLHEARDSWNLGHGEQQTGLMQASNPVASGANAMTGERLTPEQQGNANVQGYFSNAAGQQGTATRATGAPRGAAGSEVPMNTASAYGANSGNSTARNASIAYTAGNPANWTNPVGWTAIASSVLGPSLGINTFSGKSRDQAQRDRDRSQMQDFGILNDDYLYTLPDGSTFDFGLDGGAKTPQGTHYYEYNTEDPLLNRVNEMAKPSAMLLAGGDPNRAEQWAAYITNMAQSNQNTFEGMRQNILDWTSKFKMSPQEVKDQLSAWKDQGKISEEQFTQLVNTIQNDLMEGGNGTYEPPQPTAPSSAPAQPRVLSAPVQRSQYWNAATNKPMGLVGAQPKANGSALPAAPRAAVRQTGKNPLAK